MGRAGLEWWLEVCCPVWSGGVGLELWAAHAVRHKWLWLQRLVLFWKGLSSFAECFLR